MVPKTNYSTISEMISIFIQKSEQFSANMNELWQSAWNNKAISNETIKNLN